VRQLCEGVLDAVIEQQRQQSVPKNDIEA
jgi:hypothetical protein